jgi:hypothetical protein
MVLHENTSPRSILLLLLFVPVMCGYDGGVGSVAHRPDLGQGDEMPGDISEELRNAISFYRSEILECTGGSCGDADLWRGLCVALRRAEQFSACLEATQTLLRIDPSPVNHRDAGLLLSLMEKRQAAARQLEVRQCTYKCLCECLHLRPGYIVMLWRTRFPWHEPQSAFLFCDNNPFDNELPGIRTQRSALVDVDTHDRLGQTPTRNARICRFNPPPRHATGALTSRRLPFSSPRNRPHIITKASRPASALRLWLAPAHGDRRLGPCVAR